MKNLLYLLFFIFFSLSNALSFKCSLCKYISKELSHVHVSQPTEKIIDNIAIAVCNKMNASHHCLGEGCKTFCRDIVSEYTPMILNVLNDSMKDDNLCINLKLCNRTSPIVIPTEPQIITNLSNYSGEKRGNSWFNTSEHGYFVHFTDIHFDRKYEENYTSNCSLPLCCRNQSGNALLDSNDPLAAGYWGTLKSPCDIPTRLLEHVHHWFSTLDDKPDFVINTGDNPAHDVWAQSHELNLESTEKVIQEQLSAFKNISVFSSLGNHEFFPVDDVTGSTIKDSWLYDNVAEYWSYWLSDEAIRTVKHGGFYASRAREGLRIVSLSTTALITDSFYHDDTVMGTWPDPFSQMAWLNNTLKQSLELGEKVIVLGHHPHDWESHVIEVYRNIMTQYSEIIILQLSGHTHMNDFSVFTSSSGKLLYPWFIGGALTTTGIGSSYNKGVGACGTSGNPGFTIYRYNRTSLEMLDIEYWWADLTMTDKTMEPIWKKQYSTKNIYQMENMSVESWYLVEDKIKKNKTMSDLFNLIWTKGI